MTFEEQIEVFKRLNNLIRRKQTGNPAQLAQKLNISLRSCHRIIKTYKSFFPVEWSNSRNSYVYYFEGVVKIMEFENHEIELGKNTNGKMNLTH